MISVNSLKYVLFYSDHPTHPYTVSIIGYKEEAQIFHKLVPALQFINSLGMGESNE